MNEAPESIAPPQPVCPRCQKPLALCVCDEVKPVDNKTMLLVLQHPQEQDRSLGTARLATVALANAALKVGLSWPSLGKALGREADPGRWAILHLGAAHAPDLPRDREVVVLDRNGVVMPDQDAALASIRGIIAFDGSWSQAKTLWWRNPWVLKTRRLVLNPKQPSLYGKLRREPRRESLSTIEAAGLALGAIEKRPQITQSLRAAFELMLARYREVYPEGEPRPGAAKRADAPKRRWGKRRHRSTGSVP